jgi:hypothetical protein
LENLTSIFFTATVQITVNPVNVSDITLFDRSFTNLLEIADNFHWNLKKSFITLDAGLYSDFNRSIIRYAGMIPVIRPNPQSQKRSD